MDPIQEQVDAYNGRDLGRFLSCYSDDIVIEDGEPHRIVPEVAARNGADLIVIGRGVQTGVLGRLRAHGCEIIRNAPCPVLSI